MNTKKDRVIRHAYNLKFYRPTWWERAALYFIELQTHEQQGVVVTYKLFFDRLYVYTARQVTYALPEPPNGGVNKPWVN